MRNEQDFAAYVREKYQANRQRAQRMRTRLIRSVATLCAGVILFVGVMIFVFERRSYHNSKIENGMTNSDSLGNSLDSNWQTESQATLDIAFEKHLSNYAIPDRIVMWGTDGTNSSWDFSSDQSEGLKAITQICDWILTESFTELTPNSGLQTPKPPCYDGYPNDSPSNSPIEESTYQIRILYGQTVIYCALTEAGVFQMNDGQMWQVSPDAVKMLIESFSK